MSAHSLFCNAFTLLVVFFFFTLHNPSILGGDLPIIAFTFLDDKNEFRAGETAAIQVVIRKDFKSEEDRRAFNPNVSIDGVMGNSSLITDLWFDRRHWRIYFVPMMVGLFHVLVTENRFGVGVDHFHLHYSVAPGPIYEPGGVVSWMDQYHDFAVEGKATVLILPKDAFRNNVTRGSEEQSIHSFEVSATVSNGSNANLLDVINKGWNEFGYVCIEFVVFTAGHLSVHIKHKNTSLINSPLPLTVHPGTIDVANCLAHWSTETNSFQLLSIMETFVAKTDKYGNLVPGLFDFQVELMEKGTVLALPISELQYKEVSPGVQSLSFRVVKPGNFLLLIEDYHRNMLLNTPFEFSTYVGYCDGKKSHVSGPGLYDSIAGQSTYIRIVLRDAFEYPSPVELERLQVEITAPTLSLRINTQIHPWKNIANGTHPTGMLSHGAFGPTGTTHVFSQDNSAENSKIRSYDFNVSYMPEKVGVYEIRMFCGNIPLNGGRPIIKKVLENKVNASTSRVVKYDERAPAGVLNEFVVQLLDSFYNPVLYKEKYLKLEMASTNGSYYPCYFDDNHDGTYKGCYLAQIPGYYEFCVSYDGQRLLPWPFGVHAVDGNLFPTVRNDNVNVWEDQSTTFDVFNNDVFFDGPAKVVEFQKASHGSVLQFGNIFRYTPYTGYCGRDKFSYKVVDAHGSFGTAAVIINVLAFPPQFVSSPKQLQAVEDTLSPQFGGYPGFEIVYSDPLENISVILTAQNGTVYLSPLMMQFWDPMWNEISVSKVEGKDEYLTITGRLEAINFALKSLKYIGNTNFNGEDIIEISTINVNGQRHIGVPVFVESVNDPPVINAPKFIILENENEDKGFLIFDRHRDTFRFFIEDPDHVFHPGNLISVGGKDTSCKLTYKWGNTLQVIFSVEVSFGTFSARLPAHLISTTEVKLKGSKQWQLLQTFVEISKHFTLNKVKGIRFLGTLDECNALLHQLVYYGDEHDAVLKLKVNDMGWFGCYPDCSEMILVPLTSEATVSLITRTPMNSLVAHSLGFLIVVESIGLSSLAVILMFFTCKCVTVLVREKTKQQEEPENLQLNEPQNTNEQMSSVGSPENTIQLTGDRPSSFGQTEEPSSLPNPAEETTVAEIATMVL